MVRAPGTAIDLRLFCDGQYLSEHAVVLEGNKVTCWVPSEEGKAFEIHADLEPVSTRSTQAVTIRVFFDGSKEHAAYLVLRKRLVVDRIATEDGVQRWFCFSKLKLLENDDAPRATEDQIKSLGTIHIRLQHVLFTGQGVLTTPPVASPEVMAATAVNERSKKGGGHVISLGPGCLPATSMREAHVVPLLHLPSIDVVFHYAPRELLMAREIIPRPPSSPPVTKNSAKIMAVKREREVTDDEAGALSDEEDAATFARLKAKIAGKKRVKSSSTAAKPEPTDISTRIFKKGEVIVISD